MTALKRFILAFMFLTLQHHFAFAGGVVQEMYTDPNSETQATGSKSSALSVTNPTDKKAGLPKEKMPTRSQEPKDTKTYVAPACSFKAEHCMIDTQYNASKHQTVVRWKPKNQSGQKASEYRIYRRAQLQLKWTLLGTVLGTTHQFTDSSIQGNTEYFYRVIGIYKVNGEMTSWRYPLQEVKTSSSELAQSGLGCQISNGHSKSSFPYFFLFLLPLILLKKKRSKTFSKS